MSKDNEGNIKQPSPDEILRRMLNTSPVKKKQGKK